MTRIEIMTELGHLLERNKNRLYEHPVLIWKGQRLDLTDSFKYEPNCPVICKLTQLIVREGPNGGEWTKLVSAIQQFLKGKE